MIRIGPTLTGRSGGGCTGTHITESPDSDVDTDALVVFGSVEDGRIVGVGHDGSGEEIGEAM